jgi:probable HAF family extracellular repeat protein
MKTNSITMVVVLGLLVLLMAPVLLAAQNAERHIQMHHYKLIDMGTFGGNISAINFSADINDKAIGRRGTTVGFSETGVPRTAASNHLICGGDDGFGTNITHAFRWQNGIVDLGALAPAEENCSNAYQVNVQGEIVGFSENGQLDPLTGFNQSRAILWKYGQINDLGSLGGNQNEALAINDHGQIVGFSQNTIPDPYSFFDFLLLYPTPPNGTQTRAVLWQDGAMQDLGALGTGTDAAAFMINERGQIAGLSYTNTTPNPVTGLPQVDPFIWDRGKMIDIGTFGGAFGQPNFLNNRGQLVGGLSVPADPGACFFEDYPNCHPFLWGNGNLLDLATTSAGGIPQTADGINDSGKIIGAADFTASGGSGFDAYLWTKGVAEDLGTLPGDCGSRAMAINSRSQVVGHAFSCPNFDFHHSLLWQDGSIIDLNSLIPANFSLELAFANDINDRGEIAGMGVPPGVDPANVFTQGHAFLLIPCDENHLGLEGCDYSMVDASAPTSFRPTPRAVPGNILPLVHSHRNKRLPFRALATSGGGN